VTDYGKLFFAMVWVWRTKSIGWKSARRKHCDLAAIDLIVDIETATKFNMEVVGQHRVLGALSGDDVCEPSQYET
jgi:hypothetical protein